MGAGERTELSPRSARGQMQQNEEVTLEQDLGAEGRGKGTAEAVTARAEAGGQGAQGRQVCSGSKSGCVSWGHGFREGVLGNQLGKGHWNGFQGASPTASPVEGPFLQRPAGGRTDLPCSLDPGLGWSGREHQAQREEASPARCWTGEAGRLLSSKGQCAATEAARSGDLMGQPWGG